MKTEITIKGQLSSMSTLRGAMNNYEAIITGSFNNYLTLVYPTKKSALKAISEAKKYLRQKSGQDLLSDLILNQPFYQRVFTTETSQTENSLSVKLVIEPEIQSIFGEQKTRQYLLHKINAFQEIIKQNTNFKGAFDLASDDLKFTLESAG